LLLERLFLLNSLFSLAEIDEYYADVKYERIAILNALGAFHTFLGKVERAQQKEVHFKEATQCYNRASRIDETEPSTWIGRGSII
jgi:RNA polymerase-associated protein CTR9